MHFLEWNLLYFHSIFSVLNGSISNRPVISQHWFRFSAPSHYLSQWWPSLLTIAPYWTVRVSQNPQISHIRCCTHKRHAPHNNLSCYNETWAHHVVFLPWGSYTFHCWWTHKNLVSISEKPDHVITRLGSIILCFGHGVFRHFITGIQLTRYTLYVSLTSRGSLILRFSHESISWLIFNKARYPKPSMRCTLRVLFTRLDRVIRKIGSSLRFTIVNPQ